MYLQSQTLDCYHLTDSHPCTLLHLWREPDACHETAAHFVVIQIPHLIILILLVWMISGERNPPYHAIQLQTFDPWWITNYIETHSGTCRTIIWWIEATFLLMCHQNSVSVPRINSPRPSVLSSMAWRVSMNNCIIDSSLSEQHLSSTLWAQKQHEKSLVALKIYSGLCGVMVIHK